MSRSPEKFIGELVKNAPRWMGASSQHLRRIKDIAEKSVRYYSTPKDKRETIRDLQELENRWYASLKTGKPDYSIYEDPVYVGDLISCWLVYSSKYLYLINRENAGHSSVASSLSKVRTVVDLGCGLGYTTAELKRIFPKARVIGTNVKGAPQTAYGTALGKIHKFEIITDTRTIGPVDLVFASEYFEHFFQPLDHLREVLERLRPRALLLANAFGSISIGHFNLYDVGRLTPVPGHAASKEFNKLLRSRGYRKVETGLWNNRPAYWTKDPTVNLKS